VRAATPALEMSDEQREMLVTLSKSGTMQHRVVVWAKALLSAADGLANTGIARQLAVSPAGVTSWRERFAVESLPTLCEVRGDRGRKPSSPKEKIDQSVRLCSTRNRPARRAGVVDRWPRL